MTVPAPNDAGEQHKVAAITMSRHAKSFWLATLFLPKGVADEAAVLYRFCRAVDDIADESPCKDTARRELEEVQQECIAGQSDEPSVHGFLEISERRNIPPETAVSLIDGVLSDLNEVRVQNQTDLLRYAYHVAGVVGRMMCGVLRVRSPKATSFAVDLGLAMQITNICRDVREDAEMGRVYIPNDLLSKHGVSTEEILSMTVSKERIRPIVNDLLQLADALYERALDGMRFIPIRSRIGILIARRVYRAIGHKLRARHDSDPFHGRTVVGKIPKLFLVALGILDLCHPVVLGWRRPKTDKRCATISWKDLIQPSQPDEHRHLTLLATGGKQ